MKKPPKLVKAGEIERRSGAHVKVKRDCTTGRFVDRKSRVNDCVATVAQKQPDWTETSAHAPRVGRVCWPTRRDALLAFKDANQDVIDAAGGLTYKQGAGGAFDAVNEQYGIRARTLAAAIDACLPRGKPFCLDRFDLATLNETQPALEAGGFRLPDIVEEHKIAARHQVEAEELAGEISRMIAPGEDEESDEEQALERALRMAPSSPWSGDESDPALVAAQAGELATSLVEAAGRGEQAAEASEKIAIAYDGGNAEELAGEVEKAGRALQRVKGARSARARELVRLAVERLRGAGQVNEEPDEEEPGW